MGDEHVCDGIQPLPGVVVGVGDGLVGAVAARHHENTVSVQGGAERVEQQVVQRRVRQHEAEEAVARGHRGSNGALGPGPAPEQHHRPPVAAQQCGLVVRHLADLPNHADIGCHEGEGLVLPDLPGPQLADGLLVAIVADQVIAAEALEGDDTAAAEQIGTGRQRFPGTGPGERNGGPARRAGDGMRMEAAIPGIPVLGPARLAHREPGHGGVGPVVGDVRGDGETRPAVGAVGERVAVPAGAGIPDLGEAVLAGGNVRGDQGEPATPRNLARHDGEGSLANRD